MKTIFNLIILSFLANMAYAQSIDENGRSLQQRNAMKQNFQTEIGFSENKSLRSATTFSINYVLPEGKTKGEIKFFNPNKDEELKSLPINQKQGSVSINIADFALPGVIAGLYAERLLIETIRIKLSN